MSHQDILVIILLAAAAITNVVLSLVAVRCAKGPWKLVATLPILGVFAVGLTIVLGMSRDPTSHNLWPLEVVLWSGVGIIFSVAFIVFQKAFSGPNNTVMILWTPRITFEVQHWLNVMKALVWCFVASPVGAFVAFATSFFT